MKEVIYNLILACIGLFVVYIIYSNYLGTDKESFEVDEENNTTTYDPKDAMSEADKNKEEKSNPDNKTVTGTPSSKDMGTSAPSTFKTSGSPETTPQTSTPATPGESENFDNIDDDNSSKSDESNDGSVSNENNKGPVGLLQNMYALVFGWETKEGFNDVHWLRRNHRAFNRFRYHRRRGRGWRRWRRRRKNFRRAWHHYHRRRRYYWRRWHRWNRWRHRRWRAHRHRQWLIRRARARARAARRRRAAQRRAQPYINLWNRTRNEAHGIRANVSRMYRMRGEYALNHHEKRRADHETWKHWGRKLRHQHRHYPWNNRTWHRRGHSYINSVNWWLPRRRPRAHRHWHWDPPRGSYQRAINHFNHEINMKRVRVDEAKKAGVRSANWQGDKGVTGQAKRLLGGLQPDKKTPKADEAKIAQLYGISSPIKNWDKKNIETTRNWIDEKYTKIQEARAAALKKAQAMALEQKRAAQEAAAEAAAAAGAMANAEKQAQAAAAAQKAKEAAENARKIAAMGSTFNKHEQSGRDANSNITASLNAMKAANVNTINVGNDVKNTIDDLLKLQAGRVAKVEAVPMDAIKSISLRARQNYDKSLKRAASG